MFTRRRLEPVINQSTKILRVSSVMTPNLFWATEIPLESMHLESTPLGKVLKMEFELRGLYTKSKESKLPIKLVPDGSLNPATLVTGKLVAVRRHHSDPHWYRGRILSMFQSDNAPDVARVFLLDYGEYLEDVNIRINVRKLPLKMTIHPKPLAVPLVLAGTKINETNRLTPAFALLNLSRSFF